MTTRRDLAMTAAAAAALATAARPASAQTAPAPPAAEASGTADFLFVQTAARMSFDPASEQADPA